MVWNSEKVLLSYHHIKNSCMALNSKESKRQYPKRLQTFLDFTNIKSDPIEDPKSI